MKRKTLKGVVATMIVALLAGYGISKSVNNSSTELSELTLANVEALAIGEGAGGGSSSVTCFNVYDDCWFWGCTIIYRCHINNCYTVSSDKHSILGECTKK